MKEIKEFKVLLEGNPSAEALVSQEPLSFWGGVDVASGAVLDIHHDLCGENVTGKVPVSYTHLDVYKRQERSGTWRCHCDSL